MAKAKTKIIPILLLGGGAVGAYFLYKYFKEKPEPGYPKQICRDPYCFTVNNQAEEEQMNDFLGIDPPGEDIDTYLSKLTLIELDEWKNYWVSIWNSLGRSDMILFVNNMYDKYVGVPGYPKPICRNPYCFDVYNQEQETQMNDFLGIYPIGEDIDTYLLKLDFAQLMKWHNYWADIWNSLGRIDMVKFVSEMYEKYVGVVPPEDVSTTIDNFTITI